MANFKKQSVKNVGKKSSAKDKAERAKRDLKPTSSRVLAVIVRPRITEKAAHLAGDHVYTFTVLPNATKREIALAIRATYGVTPTSVNTAAVPRKRRVRGKHVGFTAASKKAYVRLAKGETIDFV